jgi:hypothetical protein
LTNGCHEINIESRRNKMKIGSAVETKDGKGKIVDIEFYNRLNGGINRYGVELDVKKYDYPVAYYWPGEIK